MWSRQLCLPMPPGRPRQAWFVCVCVWGGGWRQICAVGLVFVLIRGKPSSESLIWGATHQAGRSCVFRAAQLCVVLPTYIVASRQRAVRMRGFFGWLQMASRGVEAGHASPWRIATGPRP